MDLPSANQQVVRGVEIRPPSARAETWNVLRVAALIVLATWIYLAGTAEPRRGADAGWLRAASAGAAGGGGGGGGGAAAAPPGGSPAWSGAAAAGGVGAVAGGGAGTRDLMPYQRLFRSLGGEDQRLFRELQEGLLEAENVRSSTRRWPAPAALGSQGIPPFAGGPGRGGRRLYRWELLQEGPYVNYLGLPSDRRDPAFLLLVQEPDPQALAAGPAPAAPAALAPLSPNDEMHHRLPDGTILHVSTWMRPPGPGAADAGGRVIVEPYLLGWSQLLVGAAQP
jgi:hypothetical protein